MNFKHCLGMFLWLTLLTGLIYPLLITLLAQLSMHTPAQGSFVEYNGVVIGSGLIGQKFESDKYFWPRPSAVDYNPLPSGGSNLGPTSAVLKKQIDERIEKILHAHDVKDPIKIPSDLVYASGSGLDPHITPEAAYFQIKRVMKARNLNDEGDQEAIKNLINNVLEPPMFGFLGASHVNVLLLNNALDEMEVQR